MNIITRIYNSLRNRAYIKFIKSNKTEWEFNSKCKNYTIKIYGSVVCFCSFFYSTWRYKYDAFIFQKEDGTFILVQVSRYDSKCFRAYKTFKSLEELFHTDTYKYNKNVIKELVKKGYMKDKEYPKKIIVEL